MAISTLLIVSSDPDFAPTVMARWQSQPVAFVALGDGRAPNGEVAACDLALCGQAPLDWLVAILRSLDAAGKPAICLAADSVAASTLRQAHSRAIVVLKQDGWFENLVLLAGELVRAIRREQPQDPRTQVHAALGRFILDMRHRINNALTSILGNSELLLLDPDSVPPFVREQVAIMHDMALRIHEVIQRFTALEQGMKNSSPSQSEITLPPRTMLHATAEGGAEAPPSHGSGMS